MTGVTTPLLVPADRDRFDEHRGLGISVITFKVTPADAADTLIIENTFRQPGGPARHLHHAQDEWFYIAAGEFQFEVGDERYTLHPGDSLLGPRGVPHVWAYTGRGGEAAGLGRGEPAGLGRILISFLPAGQMEAFFRIVTQANAMPPQDPALWQAHGMDLLGPPLKLD